jgi:glutamine synthetase
MSSKVSIAEWDNNKSLKILQVRYTDVLGRFLARYLSMPADIKDFFRHGIGLDGSSIRGFAHIDDSTLIASQRLTSHQDSSMPKGHQYNGNCSKLSISVLFN